MVGRFRLSGVLLHKEGGGEVHLQVPFRGVGGDVYLREVPLVLGSDEAAYLRHNWRPEATAVVEGNLLPARDTLRLEPQYLFLLGAPVDPPLNQALLWAHVRERVAENVYLMASSPEGEEMFPIESPIPLRAGRDYHMEGLLSPRLYPRQNLLQVRFKATQVREHLALLQVKGTKENPSTLGGEVLRQFFGGP